MKKLTDWYIDDKGYKREKQVQKAFQKWYRTHLHITHGSGRTVEEIFGLPYTSSSSCAMLGNCQAEATLVSDPQWKFDYLAISNDMEILAVFEREETGNFDEKEIVIGKIVV